MQAFFCFSYSYFCHMKGSSISPPYIKPGDLVKIVAPAGRVDRQQLEYAFQKLKSWGVRVKEGEHLFDQNGYFAGTDEARRKDLQNALDDADVKAIFCVRGGYGLSRIIDDICLDGFKINPKWVIGFSDITALHLLLANNGFQSIHGIMPVNIKSAVSEDSIEHLRSFLFGQVRKIEWEGERENIHGEAKGFLRGGNLSILSDSLGTGASLKGKDTILFIEEVDEYLYKIDRMLMHLKRAGVLAQIKGLIVGHFTSIKDTKIPFGLSLRQLISEKIKGYDIPLSFGLPAGHNYPNLAMPHNRWVELTVKNDGSFMRFK